MPPSRSRPLSVSPLLPSSLRLSILLLLTPVLKLACDVVAEEDQDCPNECSCFNNFVSCYQFTDFTLQTLPTTANTLVLNGGNITSFPKDFARRFPQLTLLDIQSANVSSFLPDTFSGLKGLDQLAMTDCHIGTIESGAFANISDVSQIFFSGSVISAIRTGAFSRLSNIGEFNIWSMLIGRLESGAFQGLSDIDSFSFYLNNVTALSRGIFVDIRNMGKVDVYMNRFSHADGGALMPLLQATSDMNMFANTYPCTCSVIRDFNTPLLKPYLVSQKCLQDMQVLRLSDINIEMCKNSSQSLSFSSTTSTMFTTSSSLTNEVVTVTFSTTMPIKVTQIVNIKTSPKKGGNEPKSLTSPTPAFLSTSSATDVTGAIGGDRSTKRGAAERTTGRSHNSGQTEDSSNCAGVRRFELGCTVVAIVPFMLSVLAQRRGLLASA